MSGERVDYGAIYNGIYSANPNYCGDYGLKDKYVDAYAAKIGGKILDAGCGQGIHLKRLLKQGRDVFGLEVSEICCQKYLQGVPHECSDIAAFCRKNRKFDGVICMDVLEHLAEDDLDEVLKGLSAVAPSACFGIANHSDVQNGVELHVIQKDSSWWEKKLSKYYRTSISVPSVFIDSSPPEADLFFIFECYNAFFEGEYLPPGDDRKPERLPAYDEAFFRQTKHSIREFVGYAAVERQVRALQNASTKLAEDFRRQLTETIAAKDDQFARALAEQERQFREIVAVKDKESADLSAAKDLELARVLASRRYKIGSAILWPLSALKDLLGREK